MGIQKINKYLIKVEEECAIKGIEKAYLSNISGCRLAIDAYMFIYQALYSSQNFLQPYEELLLDLELVQLL